MNKVIKANQVTMSATKFRLSTPVYAHDPKTGRTILVLVHPNEYLTASPPVISCPHEKKTDQWIIHPSEDWFSVLS